MRDPSASKWAVGSLQIAPHARADVLKAQATFIEASDKCAIARGELDDLKEARERTIADAKRAAVDAAVSSGKIETVSISDAIRDFAAQIEAKQIEVETLNEVVHVTGNAFGCYR
jgi:hypothetical protein